MSKKERNFTAFPPQYSISKAIRSLGHRRAQNTDGAYDALAEDYSDESMDNAA